MSGFDKRYQVFVSSTYEDLIEERQAVMQALLELDCIPSGMELFPAADDDQWTLIKRVIDDCDYYIVIIAGRYGSLGAAGLSYTQMEYEYAISQKKPVIAFLHKDISALPGKKLEATDGQKKKLEEFRTLAQRKVCKHWVTSAELGSVVSRSLIQLIKTNPAVGWVKGNLVADESAAQEILKLRRRVEELEELVPHDIPTRPEVRSIDYFKKLAEKYPRNAIQEAWSYVEKALDFAMLTHDLDARTGVLHQLTLLYRHGELTAEEQTAINQLRVRAQSAKSAPDLKLTTEEALSQIDAMVLFSKRLVEKCDGVWTIRRDASVS